MNNAVKAHFMYEQGKTFEEIAIALQCSPKEAAFALVSARIAKEKFEKAEPVVYRKRMTVKKPQKRTKRVPARKSAISNEQLEKFLQAAKEKGWA